MDYQSKTIIRILIYTAVMGAIAMWLCGCNNEGAGIANKPTAQGGGAPVSGDRGISINMPIAGGGGVAVLLGIVMLLIIRSRNKAIAATDVMLKDNEKREIPESTKEMYRSMFKKAGVETLVKKRLKKIRRHT